jgi:serine/threonine protein phosphatase PrpC
VIRTERAHLYLAAESDPGLSGKNNEDNFAVSAYSISEHNPTPSVFAIISDGIGGHRSGEVASEMTVNLISQIVSQSDGGHPLAIFQQGFYAVSEAIVKQAELDVSQKGMGATAACVWVIGQQLYTAYAGDSRIYLMRGKRIQKLSRDHTWVQEALDKGVLDKAAIKIHPNLHVIRRYIGSSEPPEPDLRLYLQPGESDQRARANQGVSLIPGDVILLCTDGLTDLVNDNEILNMLEGRSLKQTAKALIDLANQRGGHDNITVILLGIPGWEADKQPGWKPG